MFLQKVYVGYVENFLQKIRQKFPCQFSLGFVLVHMDSEIKSHAYPPGYMEQGGSRAYSMGTCFLLISSEDRRDTCVRSPRFIQCRARNLLSQGQETGRIYYQQPLTGNLRPYAL
jgi:hypothetical protein